MPSNLEKARAIFNASRPAGGRISYSRVQCWMLLNGRGMSHAELVQAAAAHYGLEAWAEDPTHPIHTWPALYAPDAA